jgi:hypothetical protein
MQLNNIEVKRYDMISVPFPAGSGATKLTFPDQPQLRGAKVHGIELVFSTIDINNVVNNNYLGIGGGIENLYLTLYFNGQEGIKNIPLGEIAHVQTNFNNAVTLQANNNGILALKGQVITWTKSYLTLAQAAPPVNNGVFVIGVYYSL